MHAWVLDRTTWKVHSLVPDGVSRGDLQTTGMAIGFNVAADDQPRLRAADQSAGRDDSDLVR
jgi:hypothetical protein